MKRTSLVVLKIQLEVNEQQLNLIFPVINLIKLYNYLVGPKFLSINQTKLVKRGESVTFYCDVDGNPPPEIRWYRKDKEEFIAIGKKFVL